MAKTIIKETFIIILTTVAIGLVLAVIFYQFLPTNKIVPSKVTAYSTPENVEKEIKDDYNGELESSTTTYTITDADLSLYKRTQSYNPGKSDPFAAYTEEPTGGDGNSIGNTGNNNQNINRNTTDNYYTAANIVTGTK